MSRFVLRFISTEADLIDGLEAKRSARTHMPRWARAAAAGIGFVWVVAALRMLATAPTPRRSFLLYDWLLVGVALIWGFALKPILDAWAVHRRAGPSENVELDFRDDGILVTVDGAVVSSPSWKDLCTFLPASKGILFRFADGWEPWLPDRVFSSGEKADFVSFVKERLGRDDAAA